MQKCSLHLWHSRSFASWSLNILLHILHFHRSSSSCCVSISACSCTVFPICFLPIFVFRRHDTNSWTGFPSPSLQFKMCFLFSKFYFLTGLSCFIIPPPPFFTIILYLIYLLCLNRTFLFNLLISTCLPNSHSLVFIFCFIFIFKQDFPV